MDYDLGPEARSLRAELRERIARELPRGFHGSFTDDPADFELTQRFSRKLAEDGLLTLAWPAEYGGRGGSVWEQTVVREEMWAHHEPRGPQYMGLNWVGPAIMRFGTEAQKAHHLPLIGRGEVVWCQGFSEPNAGSDLASLRTSATLVDGRWRINGQKIWTSYAPVAQYCMLATRTSRADPPRDGITVFMLPMDRPGIEIRPIASMLGPQHLNEVFITDVEADPSEVLGEVNGGWEVIRYILTRERIGIARYARCDRLLNEVRAARRAVWSDLPATLRARFATSAIHTRVARLLAYQVVSVMAEGDVPDADAATARIAVTRGDQEVTDVLMEVLGESSLDAHGANGAPLDGAVEEYWRYAQAATVASGALEVQQTLLARGVLAGQLVPHGADGSGDVRGAALTAFARAGGTDAARRAEREPGVRTSGMRSVLDSLGIHDLDVRRDPDDLGAAGQLCRAAGSVALPYPIVSVLAAPPGYGGLSPLAAGSCRVDHGDLLASGGVIAVIGDRHRAVSRARLLAPGRLAPFVAEVTVGDRVDTGSDPVGDLALWFTLSAWWMLGAAERALDLTVTQVNEREQFGSPLAKLQSVRFRVADAAVLVRGLAELARFTSWRLLAHPEDSLVDALALRVVAQETVRATFRTAHQLHGANGFCDEHDLSVLSRHVQPYLRLPLDHSSSVALFAAEMDRHGFDGLFGRHR